MIKSLTPEEARRLDFINWNKLKENTLFSFTRLSEYPKIDSEQLVVDNNWDADRWKIPVHHAIALSSPKSFALKIIPIDKQHRQKLTNERLIAEATLIFNEIGCINILD